MQYRFSGGVPNQLTQTAQYGGTGASAVEFVRNLVPTSFYAQDQWTSNRLTLQGGVRYDYILTSYPDSCVGGPGYPLMPTQICYPARSTDGVHWTDVTPRIGAAYDLFGNGKTAVKFNIGKYMQALTASNSDMDLNPLIRLNLQTTRTWNDRGGLGVNGDYVPQCDLLNPAANGECGAMDNQNFGKEFFTRTFDPDFINGYGDAPVQLGDGRVGAAGSRAARRRHGRLLPPLVRQLLHAGQHADRRRPTTRSSACRFPLDPRLPGGGGGVVSGVYNLNPNKVGQVQDLAQLDSKARRRADRKLAGRGLRRQRAAPERASPCRAARARDARCRTTARSGPRCRRPIPGQPSSSHNRCAATRSPGLTRPYCRIVEPYMTSFRGLATYIVPKVDVQVSGTWRSDPGTEIQANYVVTNAIANSGPQPLGRNLSSGNITVNLIPQGTLYSDRRNNIDFRVGEDPPLRPDAHAGRDRRLQHPEQRHRHDRTTSRTWRRRRPRRATG